MKRVYFILFSFLILALNACNENRNSNKTATASLQIEGMVCEMGCARVIEDKLAELNGVKNANVDFSSEIATFQFNPDILNEKEVVAMIEEMGGGDRYKIRSIEIEMEEHRKENKDELEEEPKESSKRSVQIPSEVTLPNIFRFIFIR